MKILLIAGHGAGDPGSSAKFGSTNYKEADETRKMANLLAPRLQEYGATVTIYNMIYNAYTDWKSGSLISRAKFETFDYVLELHMNAILRDPGNGKNKGVECYVTTTEKGIGVEEAICRNIAAIGFTNRGVKRKNFSVIAAAKKKGTSAALLETCFIDDYDDMAIYIKNREKIADAVASGIAEGFGLKKAEKVNLQQWGASFDSIKAVKWVYDSPSTVTSAWNKTLLDGKKADAMINGELFTGTYKPASGCSDNITQTFGFSFVGGKTPMLSYANNRKSADWIGGYPMLLRDGGIAFDKIPAGLEGKRARSALAISSTHFALFYVRAEDGCTLEDFAKSILAKGFHTAINLDGGGSTACVTPYVTYEQGRKVRGKIAIWKK